MLANVGDSLPTFSLQSTNNLTITEQSFLNHYSVLYFYPKDSTPGCTTEGLDFSALQSQFSEMNVQIFGASMDSMRRHDNFKNKNNFSFELISDPDAELCQALGVYQLKKNFGKEYMGIVRSTFIIDPQGKIAALWSPVKVKGHAEEVLAQVKQLAN